MDSMANVGVKTVTNALLSLDGFSSERVMRGFAAHQVPCNIDYPLSAPVSEGAPQSSATEFFALILDNDVASSGKI